MRRVAPLVLLLTSASFGYIRLNNSETPPVPLQRVDNTGIQFYMNNQIVAGAGVSGKTVISLNSNPQAAARAALTTWNNVNTSNVTFLPLLTTIAGHASDGLMVIVIATTADDVSAVGSALAITSIFSAASSGQDPYNPALTVSDGSIIDTDILLNPGVSYSTDGSTSVDLQAVLTHELGHSLGADHTGVLGATMFQYNTLNQRSLSTDDLAFVNSVYPAASGAQSFGTISGTITASGGTPVPFAMLSFIDTTQGLSLGGLTNPDGTYSVRVPPGSYYIYAEPFNTIVQPGNLYLTAAQAAMVATFQPTLLGGSASPGTVAVTANNNTANTNITVTGGTSALALPFYGFGAAGKTGDIKSLSSIAGPIPRVVSGQSLDIAFSGTGFDSTMTTANIQVYGQGISVMAVHPDTVTFNGQPLVRATLAIAARQTAGLATIFVNKGGSTLSMTGILVVVPPTPSFTAPGVVSAASNIVGNGSVSPGEYVTLYGAGVAPTTGPYFGIGYTNTGYVMGFLPQNLGGVSVTFDGVPAPIFFAGSGGQINLQVPFEVAGKQSTQVVVSLFGSPSAPVTLPVVPVHPALFTYPTAASAFTSFTANQDGTINNSGNAAALGSYITVVGTGLGLPAYAGASYPIQTGAPAPAPPASALNANGYTCTIGGVSAPVAFAGWYNSLTAEAEWIVQIPPSLTTTGAVPIQFTTNGGSTQPNTVVFIKIK